MNLSEPFIRRPVMTTLVMLALLFLGILSYMNLPVSNLPDVNYPSINVTVSFPGASPEKMANSVAVPLEKEFMTIPGVVYVTSHNTLGTSSIVLQFELNKSIDSAAQDVEAAISRATPNLPPDLPNPPTYKKVNPSDTPIIYIALTSETMPLGELYTYAYTFIGQRLSMLEGVAEVLTYGSPFAVRVQVDPQSLATRSITLNEVAAALRTGNPDLPTGQLDGRNWSYTIMSEGQLYKAEQYQPLVVAYRSGAPVRIQDLGRAIDSVQKDRQSILYVNKNQIIPSVVLAVQRQPFTNTVQVAEAIEAYLPKLLAQLPSSVDMKVLFDRSVSIKESIVDVKFTLFMAFILVILVIFIYLGKIKDTVIPSLVLPLSLIGTFAVMYAMNFTIDNLSLLALTLSIGFIVDDAIVVLENIVRRVEAGESPWMASLEGSRLISFTILSMTLSLIAVFIPMVFMGGLIGKIFREFSITLVAITFISGIISLTLTPMLCSRFIPPRNKMKSGFFARISDKLNTSMLDIYKPRLKWVLNHRKLALFFGGVSLILTVYLFYALPLDFIPDEDIGFIIAYNLAEEGTSSDKMKEYQRKLIDILREDPNISSITSVASTPSYRESVNFIILKPAGERISAQKLIQQLYPKVNTIPGLTTFIKNVPLIDLSIGAQTKGAYQYALQSTDAHELYRCANLLIEKMKAEKMFQGVTSDMEINTPQLNVEILRDQASSVGITAADIETSLSYAYAGNRVTRIQTPLDQYDVILELDKKFQKNPSSLSSIYLRSNVTNAMVPMGVVANWEEGVGPNSVNHISQFPAVTINFNLMPGVPLSQAIEKLNALSKEILTPSVSGDVKGSAQTFQESIKSSGFLLILAIIAIYIVLGVLYESFIHPITILSTLPPAALGALLTLVLFGYPLSLYSFLGIILLIGIVKKNGIMMVDFALENIRQRHETPEEAIFNACVVRFRPIMMTTMAAIFGALPIALGIGAGAASRRPLGLVIIGGLLVSQLITLFLTPVIYLYLEKYEEKIALEVE